MTKEEKKLLKKLETGALDGLVGDEFFTSGGSSVWTEIKNGIATRYKQGPTQKFFNNRENERIPGVLHTLQKWVTDEEKLGFLQKFGFLLDDEDAKNYIKKFKP